MGAEKAARSVGRVTMLDGDTTAKGTEGTDGPGPGAVHVKAAVGAGRAARCTEAVVGSQQGPYGRCCQTRPLKQRLQMSLVDRHFEEGEAEGVEESGRKGELNTTTKRCLPGPQRPGGQYSICPHATPSPGALTLRSLKGKRGPRCHGPFFVFNYFPF